MKKNPVMITQFLKKCTITVIGNVIRMPFIWVKLSPSTKSRKAIGIAAAAAAASLFVMLCPLTSTRKLVTDQNWDKRCQRPRNG